MDYVDRFANVDLAEVRESGEEVWESRVDVSWGKRLDGNVIDFDTVWKPPDSTSRWIRVSDYHDLRKEFGSAELSRSREEGEEFHSMITFCERLSECIDVTLYSSYFRIKVIRDQSTRTARCQ